jgi:putative redox protein
VFTKVHVEYIAHGAGVQEKALARAIELSEDTYCPVQGMLKDTVEITSSYRLLDTPNPTTPGAIRVQA